MKPRQQGVALIEALVSILIFSVGVLGLVGLESKALTYSVDAEDRNRAALFANEVASSMWLQGSVNYTAAQKTAWDAAVANAAQAGLPNGLIGFTGATANSVTIVITWRPPSRATTDISTLTTTVILP
jgi:type IV pilus assembly protein PilV